MVNVMDWNIVVSEFEPQLHYYIPFRKAWTSLSLLSSGCIVPLLFYKNSFGIKLYTKVFYAIKPTNQPDKLDWTSSTKSKSTLK